MQQNSFLNQETGFSFLRFCFLLFKRKVLILGITVSFAVGAAVVSFFMPALYRAEATILPPQTNASSMASQMLSQLGGGGASGLAGAVTAKAGLVELYIEMLKSRSLQDKIIDRFNLKNRYSVKWYAQARAKLNGFLVVKPQKGGIISLSVVDKDPKFAALLANAFISELKNMNQTLAITEAAQRRLFFEQQVEKVKENLTQAEDEMRSFQEKTGVIKVEEQAAAAMNSIAQLRAQISLKEVVLNVMKTYAMPKNRDRQILEEEILSLKNQLHRLEVRGQGNTDKYVPTSQIPRVGTEYVRKMRNLKYQEALYKFMVERYEAAHLDEAKNESFIQVLDNAYPPEGKDSPRRSRLVGLYALFGFCLGVFYVCIEEYLSKIQFREKCRELKDEYSHY